VVLIGEIGGDEEERAAEFVTAHMTKPIVAYLAGFGAPPGEQMGQSGAIISGSSGTAAAKAAALAAVGIPAAREPDRVPDLLRRGLRERHG
jgi:succinyl-CoA synthetase alpha subunit